MTKEKIIVRSNDHLEELIDKEIKENGNECDLNHLDISNLTDISSIFFNNKFNGDISKWDTSNIINISCLFEGSQFNGDISKWDISKVENMAYLFANSNFDGDISKWDVSNVKNMCLMFTNSKFNGSLSGWDVSKVENMSTMFSYSKFKRYEDLNNWKPYNLLNKYNNIFNNFSKNKKIHWSKENLDSNKEDITNHINKYLAEKEKEQLIDVHNNVNYNKNKKIIKL